jgi:hypothetical protein
MINRQETASVTLKGYSGRVLAVKPAGQRNSPAFRVKTLSANGNVHNIIDAVSAQVTSRLQSCVS